LNSLILKVLLDRAGQLSLTRAQSVALQSTGKDRHKKRATEEIRRPMGVFQSFIWSFPCFSQNSGENSGEICIFPEFFQSFSVIVV
jgi:hypothetical protein